MAKRQTQACRNCDVPIYLKYIRDVDASESGGGVGVYRGRMADWDYVHVGWESGAGCDNPQPRGMRGVETLPGL